MIETTRLEVVTPFSILMERPVEMVVVPGVEGLFGVLLACTVIGGSRTR